MAMFSVLSASMLLLLFFPISSAAVQEFNVTVAADGTGHYRTINEAVAGAPTHSNFPYTILIKQGTYREYVEIRKHMNNIVFIGDDTGKTTITGNRSNARGFKTKDTATVVVKGDGFVAKFITFENSAPPSENQAAAFMIEANQSVLYRCDFLGHQDTLYAKKGSQFYRECNIYGTVDFIFGHALAVFQNCNMYVSLPKGTMTFTAQHRNSAVDNSGYVIQNSTLTLSPNLERDNITLKAFLGRPWSQYATVIVMESWLDSFIDPKGWMPWDNRPLNTLTYREYNNRGPGSNTTERVTWPGFRVLKDPSEAKPFTVTEFLKGDQWLKQTGIPYYGGLAA